MQQRLVSLAALPGWLRQFADPRHTGFPQVKRAVYQVKQAVASKALTPALLAQTSRPRPASQSHAAVAAVTQVFKVGGGSSGT